MQKVIYKGTVLVTQMRRLVISFVVYIQQNQVFSLCRFVNTGSILATLVYDMKNIDW